MESTARVTEQHRPLNMYNDRKSRKHSFLVCNRTLHFFWADLRKCTPLLWEGTKEIFSGMAEVGFNKLRQPKHFFYFKTPRHMALMKQYGSQQL
jgi:hypothetical protein